MAPPLVPNERLELARAIASTARDAPERRGEQALVNLWREVSKPRKGGAIKPQPPGSKVDFPDLFQQWLQDRGLEDALEFDREEKGWRVYTYVREPVIETEKDWESAFHGTWWYAVWLVLYSGIFLESNNRDLGHDYWEPGVYCSPNLDTGIWYARPQIMFGDGVYHRIIFEVRVDPKQRKQNRKRGGVQWVFPGAAVALHGVWVRANAPPANGEERVNSWQPEIEAIPPGWSHQRAIVNPRTEPWPEIVDDFSWDFDGESDCPPWMRSGTPAKKVKEQQEPEKHVLGGLYGHWLKEAPKLQAGSAVQSGGTTPKPRGSLAKEIQKNKSAQVATKPLQTAGSNGTAAKPAQVAKVAKAGAPNVPQPLKPGLIPKGEQGNDAKQWNPPAKAQLSQWPQMDIAAIAAMHGWSWDWDSWGSDMTNQPPGKKPRW